MPFSQGVIQERWCGWPLMVTRHSQQTPIPQSGPRGVPDTELRNCDSPAMATAAATAVPGGMLIRRPLTEMVTSSAKSISFVGESFWRIRGCRNLRIAPQQQVGQQLPRAQ